MQTGANTMESSMGIPQKIKKGTVLELRNSTSGNLYKETQNINSKAHKHPYAHSCIIYNSQVLESA